MMSCWCGLVFAFIFFVTPHAFAGGPDLKEVSSSETTTTSSSSAQEVTSVAPFAVDFENLSVRLKALSESLRDVEDEDFLRWIVDGSGLMFLAVQANQGGIIEKIAEIFSREKGVIELLCATDPVKNTVFHRGIFEGTVETLYHLLNLLREIDLPSLSRVLMQPNGHGHTPLHLAIERGNIDILRLFIGFLEEHRLLEEALERQNDFSETPMDFILNNPYFDGLLGLLPANVRGLLRMKKEGEKRIGAMQPPLNLPTIVVTDVSGGEHPVVSGSRMMERSSPLFRRSEGFLPPFLFQ